MTNLPIPSSASRALTHRATSSIVPHWSDADVRSLARSAREIARWPSIGQRDEILALTLYDACLRVSECIGLRPMDVLVDSQSAGLHIFHSKTGYRQVAVSLGIAHQLRGYAYDHRIERTQRFFPVTRRRVWQIMEAAYRAAGLVKPGGNVQPHQRGGHGTVHLLRHSGAIERLRRTGNPRSVQAQLGHRTIEMTMRYLATLTEEEGVALQASIDLAYG